MKAVIETILFKDCCNNLLRSTCLAIYFYIIKLTGDRVIFAESPSAPGIPVVYRTPEERSSNPDRLNLDRYGISFNWQIMDFYIT